MVLTAILIGIIGGLMSSFLGMGGGSIIIPLMESQLPEVSLYTVMASTTFFIFLISILSVLHYRHKFREVPFKFWIISFCALIFGVLTGAAIRHFINPHTIKIIFSTILIFSTIRPIMKLLNNKNGIKSTSLHMLRHTPLSLFGFFLAGAITSITGLGGGVIFIPIFISIFKIDAKNIPMLSNSFMAFGTFFACMSFIISPHVLPVSQTGLNSFLLGDINLFISFLLLIGAIPFIKIGVYLNKLFSSKTIEILLVLVLLTTAVFFILPK